MFQQSFYYGDQSALSRNKIWTALHAFPRIYILLVIELCADIRMAWRSRASSNISLLRELKKLNILTDDRVFNAMAQVDRGNFCKNDPYSDCPQSIGFAVSISAPHMHAHALDYLCDKLQPGAKALDIGSGSGYLTAAMGYLVCEGCEVPKDPSALASCGKVIGIDHIPQLTEGAIANVKKGNSELLDTGIVTFVTGDGRQGYDKEAPYDAIHVGAAIDFLPTQLIKQLKPGGKMVAPIGPQNSQQFLKLYTKDLQGDGFSTETLMGVIYVPLTDRESQWPQW